MKLYGSPTTKELKKKHSPRLVGRAEMGSWGGEDMQTRWQLNQAVPHSCVDNPGETTGEQDRPHNPGLQYREIKPQTTD